MKALRTRIIALLAVVIFALAGLGGGLVYVLLEPDRPRFDEAIDANAALIGLLLAQAGRAHSPADPQTAIGFQANGAQGETLQHLTKALHDALRRYDVPAAATVTQPAQGNWPVASIKVPGRDEVLIAPLAMPAPPAFGVAALIGWILVIAAGVTGIAVIAVYRLMRPLTLEERLSANVSAQDRTVRLVSSGAGAAAASRRVPRDHVLHENARQIPRQGRAGNVARGSR